jgi:hypothetical protein
MLTAIRLVVVRCCSCLYSFSHNPSSMPTNHKNVKIPMQIK